MDLMSRLNADICFKDKILKTNGVNIPIVYNADLEFQLDPRTEHRVRLPVNQKDGLAVLDYKQFQDDVRMPAAIVKCENYFASTVIQNTTDLGMKLTITAPFIVTKFYNDECILNTITDLTDVEIDSLLTDNI